MIFTILIPTLTDRAAMLKNIMTELSEQADMLDVSRDIEILSYEDGGEKTTGFKRNSLLRDARGEYIAFVDDDDKVAPFYCKLIMEALEKKPDVVGIRGTYIVNGQYDGVFEHSIKHKCWSQDGNKYYRCPNHLNPVRRDFALMAGFPDIKIGEDRDYSMKLLPFLQTEVMIEQPIYEYYARAK
jgi:glycosyltransferase involved in cell wall biosynthesis